MQRILVLSDLHLGLTARRTPTPAMLRPLWQGCDHLLLNGDTAELHVPSMSAPATDQLATMQQLCEEDGVGLSLIAGNHDPFISPLQRCTLVDGRVLVTHGQVIHRRDAKPPVEGQTFEVGDAGSLSGRHLFTRAMYDDAIERSRTYTPPEHELQAPQTLRDSIPWSASKPFLVLKILRYWRAYPGFADAYRRRVQPDARVVIVGHSHRDGVWQFDDCAVLNTGSWTWPGRP
ncbi:MAG: metallophosphoesterase family protein, partial [Phycisphaerales bacterium]|nr:metallophosphoesterase family protein [Phycisphaerales bacterium]